MERVFTRWELMRWLRSELQSIFDQISAALPNLPEGSIEQRIALINLGSIRREMTRREMASGPRCC